MRKLVLISVLAMLAASASAQAITPHTSPPSLPTADVLADMLQEHGQSILPDGAQSTKPTPPMPGANSFTKSQAKARIQKMGYTDITGLKQDKTGIWRGTAMKDGKLTPVSLDYKGNVVSQ